MIYKYETHQAKVQIRVQNLMQKQSIAILILMSYLCQGMASLIYQVSWEQAMEKIVGLAVPTMAMIISLFLLGMGLGAFLFSKVRLNHVQAAQFYGINQFLLFALGLIFAGSSGLNFLSCLSVNNIDWLPFTYLIRLSLLGLYLLPTAMLVGAGFPLLLSLSDFYQLNLSARQIYLFNLIGSAIGAMLTGFVLLPHIGIAKSTIAAAVIQLLAGLLIIPVSRLGKLSSPIESEDNQPIQDAGGEHGEGTRAENTDALTGAPTASPLQLIIIVSVSGFFNMFLELIFTRYYSLIMGSSTWAYSLVLVIMLLALGCGTFLTGKTVQSRLTISLLFLLAGACLLFTSFFLSQIPFIFAGLKCRIGFLLSSALILISTIFPVCLCLGAVLPCCFNAAEMKDKLSPITPGQIYAANLFAAVTGCLVGGIIAFPFLNLFSNYAIFLALTLSALALLITGAIVCLPIILSSQKTVWIAVALPVLLCLTLWPLVTTRLLWNEAALTAGLNYLSPADLKAIKCLPEAVNLPLLFYKEGLSSTASVMINRKLNVICLKTDGQMEAALPWNPSLPAPSSDEKTQIMLGLLPSAYCRNHPEDAFLLGYGTGITACSILLNTGVKNLTVAELEPAVIEASSFFSPYYGQIFNLTKTTNNSKMQIKVMDGRCLLSLLNKRYDMIVCQPGEPSRSSCGHLYTLEFWQLAKSRLQPGGVFCQWLPLYAIDRSNLISLCRTFVCVFPNTFVIKPDRSGDLILLGFKDNKMPINWPADMKQALVQLGIDDIKPWSLPDWLAKYNQVGKLNTDDFPFVQYRLQSLLAAQGNNINSDIEAMCTFN